MDQTKEKIVDAAIALIKDKGYVATTTKDIAILAGVNESTVFRKFSTKKDIILYALGEGKRIPDVHTPVLSHPTWDLRKDLETILLEYLMRVSSDSVKISIGLRAPQIYEATSEYIRQIPELFIGALKQYFREMHARGKIKACDFDATALSIFAATFGYVFLNASFGQTLSSIDGASYVRNSVALFVEGLEVATRR